jgi:hypothetical protein
VVKTLVMQDERGEPLIVLMHGDRQVSTQKLARQIGAAKSSAMPGTQWAMWLQSNAATQTGQLGSLAQQQALQGANAQLSTGNLQQQLQQAI